MKKRIVSATLTAALVLGMAAAPATVSAASTNASPDLAAHTLSYRFSTDYTYDVVSGCVTIIRYTGKGGAVKVPSAIDGMRVTKIGREAFSSLSTVSSVSIPDTVAEIGYSAFFECTALKSITLPNSLKDLGAYAFDNCKNLTSITIPDSITRIRSDTFSECTGLTSVTIPSSVTTIDSGAFYGCGSLSRIKYLGTKEQWSKIKIDYTDNSPLRYASLQYSTQTSTPDPVYPKVSVVYNEKYHQFRLNWTKVPDAQYYGVAAYVSGKWRIQKQDIPASQTVYTSPKLKEGRTYLMLVCAKINGKWDLSGFNRRAVSVTVK